MMHQLPAYAKLNLALHVTAKLPSGYHQIQSLVCFAKIADTLTLLPSAAAASYQHHHRFEEPEITLHVNAAVPLDETFFSANLMHKAARALAEYAAAQGCSTIIPVHIGLEKNLPLGAGLGGGSSDAASCLQLLNHAWNIHASKEALARIAASLGSDVAACLTPRSQWMSGTGNQLYPADITAPLWAVLAYPMQPVSAAATYQGLQLENASTILPEFSTFQCHNSTDLLTYLAAARNDLTRSAASIAPVIQETLELLQSLPQVKLVRMSGSGSCCFALFTSASNAKQGREIMQKLRPNWWCETAPLMW